MGRTLIDCTFTECTLTEMYVAVDTRGWQEKRTLPADTDKMGSWTKNSSYFGLRRKRREFSYGLEPIVRVAVHDQPCGVSPADGSRGVAGDGVNSHMASAVGTGVSAESLLDVARIQRRAHRTSIGVNGANRGEEAVQASAYGVVRE